MSIAYLSHVLAWNRQNRDFHVSVAYPGAERPIGRHWFNRQCAQHPPKWGSTRLAIFIPFFNLYGNGHSKKDALFKPMKAFFFFTVLRSLRRQNFVFKVFLLCFFFAGHWLTGLSFFFLFLVYSTRVCKTRVFVCPCTFLFRREIYTFRIYALTFSLSRFPL